MLKAGLVVDVRLQRLQVSSVVSLLSLVFPETLSETKSVSGSTRGIMHGFSTRALCMWWRGAG